MSGTTIIWVGSNPIFIPPPGPNETPPPAWLIILILLAGPIGLLAVWLT